MRVIQSLTATRGDCVGSKVELEQIYVKVHARKIVSIQCLGGIHQWCRHSPSPFSRQMQEQHRTTQRAVPAAKINRLANREGKNSDGRFWPSWILLSMLSPAQTPAYFSRWRALSLTHSAASSPCGSRATRPIR